MKLRRLRQEDWRAFRDIRLAALTDSPGNFWRALATEQQRPDDHWRELLARDDAALFGAFEGEELVAISGAFASRDDPSVAEFGMTWVAPARRGQGLGHQFYQERLAWVRARGFSRVEVSHRASNEPSRRAMLAAGFRETGRRPHRWPDGVEDDDVSYELLLESQGS